MNGTMKREALLNLEKELSGIPRHPSICQVCAVQTLTHERDPQFRCEKCKANVSK